MSSKAARAHFGAFVVDFDARQLLRLDRPVHLTPKAYHLLTLLVNACPRAVSKEELQQGLWPSTFVDEANLTVLVAELRSALQDDARQPRYVRTVHGFGYAFAADVERRTAQTAAASGNAWWLLSDSVQVKLQDGEHVIGRDPTAGVWLDSGSVSRRHARLIVEPSGVALEDLGSKNGTWVNGLKLDGRADLKDRDELRFGSVRMQLRCAWEAGSTDTLGPL